MSPELAQPPGYVERFGDPVRAAVFEGPFGLHVAAHVYEDGGDWVYATVGLCDVLGTELSGRSVRDPDASSEGGFLLELLRGMARALAAVGTRPTHGQVELVLVSEGDAPLQVLFVWDPEVEDGVGRVLRVVRITDDEAALLGQVSVRRFVDALQRALGRLVTDIERGNALSESQMAALRTQHPRQGPETIRAPVAQWEVDGGIVRCLIAEQAAASIRGWARRGSVLTVQGPTQAVAFRRGPLAIRAEGETLCLTLPKHALQNVVLPHVVRMDGLELRCCAMGVMPTGPVRAAVPHPPTRDRPRLHHYTFAYKMLPPNLAQHRLTEPGSTSRLTQSWARTGELVSRGDEDIIRFLPPVSRGLVPGTRVHGVVGLGVVDVRTIDGWSVAVVQMPLTEAAGEAYYLGVAERGERRRLLSWEKTTDGMAILGEWWVAGDDIAQAHAKFGGSPHVSAFYAALERWLGAHPDGPPRPDPSAWGVGPDWRSWVGWGIAVALTVWGVVWSLQ